MNIWVTEDQTENLRISFRVKTILDHAESKFQKCDIYDTFDFGRLMMLDNVVMLTERDEFFYHEMIAHVPLTVHPRPKRVLVIGGGDGGTIREVARHSEVEDITIVEIDKMVVDMSRKHLPFVACGFDDPRVTLHIADGIRFIQEQKNAWDIILIDSTDPVAFAEGLFHSDFYTSVREALTENGILVAQTEFPLLSRNLIRDIFSSLNQVFPVSRMYLAPVPTYPTGLWSFGFASKGPDPLRDFNVQRAAALAGKLKYYTGDTHRHALTIPPFIRELLP
ncbi:MAG: polyamine aminopropyltransferase [Acidobacteria bacterium]|nr:polyamine aminopropyltransferase [Acidobacteriota bacterium]